MRNLLTTIIYTTLALYIVSFFEPNFWSYMHEGPILDALLWNGYGAKLSLYGLLPYLLLAAYIVICVGLLQFKGWARKGLVLFTVVTVLVSPFWGLSVQYGMSSVWWYLFTLGQGAMLAMLYLTDLRHDFED